MFGGKLLFWLSLAIAIFAIAWIYIDQFWFFVLMYIRPMWIKFRYPIQPPRDIDWKIGTTEHSGRPNIILIVADDLGFNDVSVLGGGFLNGLLRTPEIDSVGKDGVIFYQSYAGYCL